MVTPIQKNPDSNGRRAVGKSSSLHGMIHLTVATITGYVLSMVLLYPNDFSESEATSTSGN